MDRVWYVAYGSNLSSERFRCYVAGGRPEGGARTYVGCRDRTEPVADAPVDLPGAVYFGGRSRVWGGGMATYDPHARGSVAGRAYLLTVGQLADVVAQETRTPIEGALDLGRMHPSTGRLHLGPGRYRTLVRVGARRGLPLVTLAGDAAHDIAAPSAAYLRTMAAGLRESRGWPPSIVGRYLAALTGARPRWTPSAIADLARVAA
ncbi:histone deacetylase [Agromyces kandeliae]|uniref:Histone deacetylase n=1 Tax=Agromyces kandeliae TaxID=2666141 RepID=A0A6L5R3M5_9MICO|nr:histone deacetylase [Agromyces kandeliae]MRX43998.1 histone deacetylase [Agromyces kandeliae]